MTKDDLVSKDTALKMAIEAMEEVFKWDGSEGCYSAMRVFDARQKGYEAINACKEALEQPAQEPVAWMLEWRDGEFDYWHKHVDEDKLALEMWFDAIRLTDTEYKIYPLYTHPHQWQGNKEFVGLTDDEIDKIIEKHKLMWMTTDFVRAIEQELKTKNGFSGLKDKNT